MSFSLFIQSEPIAERGASTCEWCRAAEAQVRIPIAPARGRKPAQRLNLCRPCGERVYEMQRRERVSQFDYGTKGLW